MADGRGHRRNCGAYLRVTPGGLAHLANLDCGQLDMSRVNPESYRLAGTLARAAMGLADDDEVDIEAVIGDADQVGRGAAWGVVEGRGGRRRRQVAECVDTENVQGVRRHETGPGLDGAALLLLGVRAVCVAVLLRQLPATLPRTSMTAAAAAVCVCVSLWQRRCALSPVNHGGSCYAVACGTNTALAQG